ncbi:MAG: glycosyltransferase [Leptospiraceae bacterium]|nr:glycosyltransferase [Leptospiraceae bacterium]
MIKKKIYIILPTHNRKNYLEKCLFCFRNQSYQDFFIVLVNDGSNDGSIELAQSIFSEDQLTIVNGNGNLWWGGSLNKGYHWISKNVNDLNSIVVFMNDDTILPQDYLEKVNQEIQKGKGNELIVSQIYNLENKFIDGGLYYIDWKTYMFYAEPQEGIKPNCQSSRGLCFTVESFLKIGGFHPTLLPQYLSDIEFTMRGYELGLELISSKELMVKLDDKQTGLIANKIGDKGLFSKKNFNNPIHRINFILLRCPWKFKLKNIFRVIQSIIP